MLVSMTPMVLSPNSATYKAARRWDWGKAGRLRADVDRSADGRGRVADAGNLTTVGIGPVGDIGGRTIRMRSATDVGVPVATVESSGVLWWRC